VFPVTVGRPQIVPKKKQEKGKAWTPKKECTKPTHIYNIRQKKKEKLLAMMP